LQVFWFWRQCHFPGINSFKTYIHDCQFNGKNKVEKYFIFSGFLERSYFKEALKRLEAKMVNNCQKILKWRHFKIVT